MYPHALRLPPALKSLSARLLVLTIFFVMLSELFIYAPSIARYRKVYLEEHIADAHLATLTLEAAPDLMIDRTLEEKVLRLAESRQIVLMAPGEAKRILMLEDAPPPDLSVDLSDEGFMSLILDAFETLFVGGDRILRVVGPSPHSPETTVEVLLDEAPLRAEMIGYSYRIFQLSLVISLFTAALVFLSLQLMMVYPLRRIAECIVRFRDDPDDPQANIRAMRRSDEIGIVMNALADMQGALRTALREKTRLAALGAAITKINHDLRNILAPAQLISDRLVGSGDPEVHRLAPRLVGAIDRAVDLCVQTLNFATDKGPPLRPSVFGLCELVDEAGGAAVEAGVERRMEWVNAVPAEIELEADRDQLFRVFVNIGRNAAEAGAGRLEIGAQVENGTVAIDLADDGPGLSANAQKRLFQPFSGSARPGGTGLGLAISDELVRAHGGVLRLVETGDRGTRFRIVLPAAVRRRPSRGEARRRAS